MFLTVLLNLNRLLDPVNLWIDSFEPRHSQNDLLLFCRDYLKGHGVLKSLDFDGEVISAFSDDVLSSTCNLNSVFILEWLFVESESSDQSFVDEIIIGSAIDHKIDRVIVDAATENESVPFSFDVIELLVV